MHTPGPWTVEEYGDEDCPALVIHRDSENRICFMATPGSHGDPARIAADACLIAAAPEVVGAGQFLLDRLDDFEREIQSEELAREWAGHVAPALSRFRAAITKALTEVQHG